MVWHKGRLSYATDVSNRSDADTEAPEWEYRASCPYCYSSKSEEEKDRARQRQFEAWGVIGGPDKCRRPTSKEDVDPKSEIAGRSAKACLA
ncbi:Rhodanese-like domain-containing protein 7 [Linum grandiflorum]